MTRISSFGLALALVWLQQLHRSNAALFRPRRSLKNDWRRSLLPNARQERPKNNCYHNRNSIQLPSSSSHCSIRLLRGGNILAHENDSSYEPTDLERRNIESQSAHDSIPREPNDKRVHRQLPDDSNPDSLRGMESDKNENPSSVSSTIHKTTLVEAARNGRNLPLLAALTASLLQPSLFPTLYSLALLGTLIGFYVFVYFTSIGYALGIGIPAAWLVYVSLGHGTVSWHSLLVVLWAIRLAGFLLHREFKAWPALHEQYQLSRQRRVMAKPPVPVSEQPEEPALPTVPMETTAAAGETPVLGSPPAIVQVLCWMVYSFFYTCLLSPCHYIRVKHQAMSKTTATATTLSITNPLALFLQLLGLALETMADYTKSEFKRRRPADWCHVGVWKYGRHVNYAGEWLFWLGTWLAGMTRGQLTVSSVMIMTIGLVFISLVLQGAAEFVGARQLEKYGHDPGYLQFCDNYGALGPSLPRMKRFVTLKLHTLQQVKLGRKATPSKATVSESDDESDSQDGSMAAQGSLLL